MQKELLRDPYLLQYIDYIHQTDKLVDKLTRKEPCVIEFVRKDLRSHELIARCIAKDSICKIILERLGDISSPPRKAIIEDDSDMDRNDNVSDFSGNDIEYFEDGFDIHFTKEKWDALMKAKDTEILKEAIERTPTFVKFLTEDALKMVNTD
jgi:hypothetical protein